MRSLIVAVILALPAVVLCDDGKWYVDHGCKQVGDKPSPLPNGFLWANGYLCYLPSLKDVPGDKILARFCPACDDGKGEVATAEAEPSEPAKGGDTLVPEVDRSPDALCAHLTKAALEKGGKEKIEWLDEDKQAACRRSIPVYQRYTTPKHWKQFTACLYEYGTSVSFMFKNCRSFAPELFTVETYCKRLDELIATEPAFEPEERKKFNEVCPKDFKDDDTRLKERHWLAFGRCLYEADDILYAFDECLKKRR